MRILLAAFSISLASTAYAQDQSDICKGAATYAESIMESRQDGVPENEIVRGADAMPGGSRDIALWIMIQAYEKPVATDTDERQQAITSFGQDIYAECMKSG